MHENLIKLIKEIRELDQKAEEYINKLVYPIDMFMVDNEHSNCQSLIQSKLMREVFGDMYEDVTWFLYEWKPGYTITTGANTPEEKTYVIETEENYYKYLEAQ